MNEFDSTRQEQRECERRLLIYTNALLSGDLETVTRFLEEAEIDPDMAQGIWETHLLLAAETEAEETLAAASERERDADLVRDLVAAHFTEPSPGPPPEPPPLTIRDVAADLRSRAGGDPAILGLLQKMEWIADPVGPDVSLRGIRTLLARLGLAEAGRRFVDLFHDAALALSFQRQQQSAIRLAATRRATAQRAASPNTNTPDEETREVAGEEGPS